MQDYEGKEIKVGDRIELHPGTDLWMRGARFGEVIDLHPSGACVVRLDKLNRSTFRVSPDNLRVQS